jgi:hypothetical protein
MPINIVLHQFRAPLLTSMVLEAISFFVQTPVHALPPAEPFPGVGVYALYLLNDANIYRDLADPAAQWPIYVGKAVPRGWRTARVADTTLRTPLYARLRQHASSIDQVVNLQRQQFATRFMLLGGFESDLIIPVEAELIRAYSPLWNTVIDGFGNHDPGAGRYDQALSEWDSLHPGRAWAARLRGEVPARDAILEKIRRYVRGST